MRLRACLSRCPWICLRSQLEIKSYLTLFPNIGSVIMLSNYRVEDPVCSKTAEFSGHNKQHMCFKILLAHTTTE